MKQTSFKTEIKEFKIGTKFINLPKNVVDSLGLEKREVVEITIKASDEEKIRKFKCKNCDYEFASSDLNSKPYCVQCESEDVELIGVVNEDTFLEEQK